jgi:hypothetical protein
MYRLENAHPSWEMHPDFVQALKSLDSYNLWICEVVMPIVFQWVQEHYEEVYKDIPTDQRDDVGVVIARAFSIVQKLSYYNHGVELSKEYAQRITNRDPELNKLNLTWQHMSAALDKAKQSAKDDFTKLLGSTVKSG